MNRILIRQAMNLPSNPWGQLNLTTADGNRVKTMVKAAIGQHTGDQAMVSILGPRGNGKTRAVRQALESCAQCQLVEVLRLDKKKVQISDIEAALADNLAPKGFNLGRTGETRTRRLRQVLGEAAKHGPIVLMVDDAHELHPNTIRATKRLRELVWGGRTPLLGVVLIGQRDMLQGIDEVQLRADTLWMEGLTGAEALTALKHTVAQAFEPAALEALATSGANWLDLIANADKALAHAHAQGHAKVTLTDAVQSIGQGLKGLAETINVSQADIARAIGSSESTVSRVLSGARQDPETQDKIAAFLLEKSGQAKPEPKRPALGVVE